MDAKIIAFVATLLASAAIGSVPAPADTLPGPRQEANQPVKTKVIGIDCSRGLACPIIWVPPRTDRP